MLRLLSPSRSADHLCFWFLQESKYLKGALQAANSKLGEYTARIQHLQTQLDHKELAYKEQSKMLQTVKVGFLPSRNMCPALTSMATRLHSVWLWFWEERGGWGVASYAIDGCQAHTIPIFLCVPVLCRA